jgi:hypothetical protein
MCPKSAVTIAALLGCAFQLMLAWGEEAKEGKSDAPQSYFFTAVPASVDEESSLGIVSDTVSAFDKNALNNAVTFSTAVGDITVRPYQVSADGRFLLVQVPKGAQSGLVKLNNNGKPIGTVFLNVHDTAQDKATEVAKFNTLVMAIFVLLVVIVVWLFTRLKRANWNIAEAVSERRKEQDLLRDANGQPVLNQGNPVYIDIYRNVSSSSRLIAVIGLCVIVIADFGILVTSIWLLLTTEKSPDLGSLNTFILALAGIFTPYVATQIREALSR